MATTRLLPDFKEFLRLLEEHEVEYLLIGGYAVGFYGYVRATADLDIWVRREPRNAQRLVDALKAFGFDLPELSASLFLAENIVRMGVPPFRIELMTSLSGVEFDECYRDSCSVEIDAVPVRIIGLDHLKKNKRAAGRHKDLDDLEHLP